MWDWLNGIINPSATPVRRQANLLSMPDPDSGKTVVVPTNEQVMTLSPQGSPDSIGLTHMLFHRCRCSIEQPVGGRCYECGGTSCVRCHGHCARCHKPICPEHSKFTDGPTGQQVRLCRVCHDSMRRKRLVGGAARILLSPFINFDKGQQP